MTYLTESYGIRRSSFFTCSLIRCGIYDFFKDSAPDKNEIGIKMDF